MKVSKFRVLNTFNVLLIIVALIQYYLLTPLNFPNEKFFTTSLPLDVHLKVIPGFIIPYFSVYVFLLLTFFFINSKSEDTDLTIFLISIVILWSAVNFLHGFLHTQNIVRAQITGTGLFFELLNDLYTSVKPYNTLPSWHASTAVLCLLMLLKLKIGNKYLMIVWCVLICLSPIFLKMASLVDVIVSIPLAYGGLYFASKTSTIKMKTEKVHEVVKAFTLESLIQSVAIGIRDESTLNSLIEGLTRVEKNLTDKDKVEIKQIGEMLDPPVESLKDVVNNLIYSIDVEKHIEKAREMHGKLEKGYNPTEKELKIATEELINVACRPFDNPKFRYLILEIKKRNVQLINISSLEEAAKERSHDIVFRFTSFIEAQKEDIPILKTIIGSANGHLKLDFDDLKIITRELRKPPYEITIEEVWNAYHRIDATKVKPLGTSKNPADIISLTQFAAGKLNVLEPFINEVDKKFDNWLFEYQKSDRAFSDEEIEWLNMMKKYISSHLEINMISFNNPPFINKGGAAKAYNIFGHDLNKIMYELNEKLI